MTPLQTAMLVAASHGLVIRSVFSNSAANQTCGGDRRCRPFALSAEGDDGNGNCGLKDFICLSKLLLLSLNFCSSGYEIGVRRRKMEFMYSAASAAASLIILSVRSM